MVGAPTSPNKSKEIGATPPCFLDVIVVHGGCSSAVECLTVAQVVAGSNPVTHPLLVANVKPSL